METTYFYTVTYFLSYLRTHCIRFKGHVYPVTYTFYQCMLQLGVLNCIQKLLIDTFWKAS